MQSTSSRSTARTTGAALAALALSLTAVACGDSGDGTSEGPTTGAPESTTSTGDAGTASTSSTTASTSSSSGEPEMMGCEFQGVDFEQGAPELLSEMCLLEWVDEQFSYEENVYPYELNTVLFSDFALKHRAIYIPPGTTATYRDNDVIDFPVGTIILKSFVFAADMREPDVNLDLVETRVLVRFPDEWKAFPYIWDHELGDAVLTVQGEVRPIEFIGPDGVMREATYLIPQKNQCQECHEIKDDLDETVMTAIGPRPRYLNRANDFGDGPVNQIAHFQDVGWLEGAPAIDTIPAAWDHRTLADTPIESMTYEQITTATRDYLDINCAYCHNPRGVNGISSQLFVNWDNEDEFHLGVCKKPGSAGKGGENREYDIVPGDAEASILVYRSETLDLGAMMPLIGRSLVHEDGIALMRAWIDGMPPDDCKEDEPDPMPP